MSVSNSVDSSPHKSRREQQFCAHIDSIKKQLQSGQLNEAKCIAAFDPILDTFRKSDSELLLCEICDLFLFVFSHENRSHFFDTRDLLQLLVTKLIVRQTSLKSQLKLLKCIKAILKVKESDFANINSNLVLSLVNKVNEQQSARIVEKIDSDNEDIMTEISWSRVVLNTVRILKHIISGRKLENIEKLLNNILGFLKFYIFYGLPGYIVNKAHIGPLYASHLNQYIPDEMANSSPNEKKQKSQKRRKQRKKKFGKNDDADDREDEIDVLSSNEFNKGTTTPSDSEQSASEYVNQSPINLRPILKQSNAKIRINSYECLCCIVQQAEKKFIFGYWSSFIPDNSGVGTTEFSVLTSILKDPTLKARRIALCFLREMLISGKHFVLTLAEEKRNHSKHPFTTLSQTLASMITEIHRCFYLLLFAETNTDVLLQALKCMSTLISVTPYNRFDSGLLTTLLNKSICLLNCERQVQNSCLALFITAFSLRPLPNEFVNWSNSEGNQHIENLLNFCFEKTSSMESIVLCNESLTFLSTFLASNISHKSLSLTKVMNLAINISSHELALINPVIQSNVCKYLHSLAIYMKTLNMEVFNEEKSSMIIWWQQMFKTLLLSVFQESETRLQSSSECTLIDFLSAIHSEIFDELSSLQRYHLISVLFSKVKSEEIVPNIKASAIRCLGVYLNFKSLTDDLSFITDVAFACKDLITSVTRSKANEYQTLIHQTTWTFANLNDLLRKFHSENEEITNGFVLDNGSLTLQLFAQSFPTLIEENVKTNIVRSFSSLTLILLQSHRYSESRECIDRFIKEVTNNLVQCLNKCKSFKLQWNICCAFSSLLSTPVFLPVISNAFTEFSVVNDIQQCLIRLIASSRNHKVQAYATQALCSPCESEFYQQKCFTADNAFATISRIMIENYSQVSPTIRSVWIEKMCNGLSTLCLFLELKKEQVEYLKQFFECVSIESDAFNGLKNRLLNF